MEWSKFIITILVVYLAYYAINILFDLFSSNKNVNKDEVIPLTFEDDTVVKSVDFEEPKSTFSKEKPANEPQEPLAAKGVINEEVLTNNDRKEEYFSPTDATVDFNTNEVLKPAGAVKVFAQNLISGGISYKELLKKASQGSILTSATIDFGEEV